MTLDSHRHDWEELAEFDPLWAVLTRPDKRGGRWDRDEFLSTGETEIAEVLAGAEQLGLPQQQRRALDFGCGAGRLTRALAHRFPTAVGVDISERMVETAQRLNADVPGCEFRVNSSPDLRQFQDGAFDLVYTSLVLQHLPSRGLIESYVTELVRVTAPGGLLVFGLPDRISWPYRLGLTRRLYRLLRVLRVPDDTILRRTPLTPMRMSALAEPLVRSLVEDHGGRVLRAEPSEGGGVRTVRYFVTPARG
jgi:SAM-dependent methyltransferase